jgi:hypothetical protein
MNLGGVDHVLLNVAVRAKAQLQYALMISSYH